MFLIMIDIDFKKELALDFKRWFSESNQFLSNFEGLISRRLIDSVHDGQYCIIMEHQSRKTFEKMYLSEEYKKLQSEASSSFRVKVSQTKCV